MARVLIVDDDVITREVLSDAFSEEGFETATAADGRQALDAVGAWDPDVILLDLMMPVMDGKQFMAAHRRLPDARAAVVIISATRPLDSHVAELGAAAAFEKPFALDVLLATVRRLVQ